MPEVIGVLNAGSSSIKFSLFNLSNDQAELLVYGQAEGIYTAPRFVAKNREGKVMSEKSWPQGTKLGHDGAIDHLFSYVRAEFTGYNLLGVGHRVVCGGLDYTKPARVNPTVLSKLERLIPLFPLHQPHNLAPIRLLLERQPELPQVACFDTSFHRTNPRIAQLYALPLEYAEAGVVPMAFTAFRMNTSPRCCPSSTRGRLQARPWYRIWAMVRACAPWKTSVYSIRAGRSGLP